jgi:hypothetical protein
MNSIEKSPTQADQSSRSSLFEWMSRLASKPGPGDRFVAGALRAAQGAADLSGAKCDQ